MPVTIRIIGLVDGTPTIHDGRYVTGYNPSPEGYPEGECFLTTSDSLIAAKKYRDLPAAAEEWKRVDRRNLVRPDGKPNRPLTAFTVEIAEVDSGKTH